MRILSSSVGLLMKLDMAPAVVDKQHADDGNGCLVEQESHEFQLCNSLWMPQQWAWPGLGLTMVK
jgi:hypothetical protein